MSAAALQLAAGAYVIAGVATAAIGMVQVVPEKRLDPRWLMIGALWPVFWVSIFIYAVRLLIRERRP
jgi:hypothetical protein